MVVRQWQSATDCHAESTDWTAIGARIVQAAHVAAAIHLAERTGVSRNEPAEQKAFRFAGIKDDLSDYRASDRLS